MFTLSKREYEPDLTRKPLGEGAYGTVYTVAGKPDLVIKCFKKNDIESALRERFVWERVVHTCPSVKWSYVGTVGHPQCTRRPVQLVFRNVGRSLERILGEDVSRMIPSDGDIVRIVMVHVRHIIVTMHRNAHLEHRDLNPTNIMVDEDDVHVIDMSNATLRNCDRAAIASQVAERDVRSAPFFRSPEEMLGDNEAPFGSADAWSIGMLGLWLAMCESASGTTNKKRLSAKELDKFVTKFGAPQREDLVTHWLGCSQVNGEEFVSLMRKRGKRKIRDALAGRYNPKAMRVSKETWAMISPLVRDLMSYDVRVRLDALYDDARWVALSHGLSKFPSSTPLVGPSLTLLNRTAQCPFRLKPSVIGDFSAIERLLERRVFPRDLIHDDFRKCVKISLKFLHDLCKTKYRPPPLRGSWDKLRDDEHQLALCFSVASVIYILTGSSNIDEDDTVQEIPEALLQLVDLGSLYLWNLGFLHALADSINEEDRSLRH